MNTEIMSGHQHHQGRETAPRDRLLLCITIQEFLRTETEVFMLHDRPRGTITTDKSGI